MDGSTMLHIWIILKILFLSSKVCERLSMFLLPYIFVFFFCTVALFLNVLFVHHQGHHAQLSFLFSCISSTVFFFLATLWLSRFVFFCCCPVFSNVFFVPPKVIMHSFLSFFFLVILQIFFFIDIKVIMLFFSSFAVICFQMFLVKSSSSS